MFEFTEIHEKLLRDYTRPIVHMRSQLGMGRFGLVFGSGLSKAFGLPVWSELVEHIAEDPEVDGVELLEKFSETKSLPYKTELLIQHFKRKRAAGLPPEQANSKAFEYSTLEAWLRIFAKHLYADAPQNIEEFKEKVVKHAYFNTYLPIVRQTLMTVTYNFDNYIERALAATKNQATEKGTRGFETVTNPWTQFQRNNSVIYHPNGFFPPELMEVPVDKFVFSEASYAEQFARVFAGDHSSLINHFCKNTCLLIGLSLEDEMLRNLLILSSRASPGNYHYHVHFMGSDDLIEEAGREAMRRTNFNVYNLITLFLNEQEITALGELINEKNVLENELRDYGLTKGIGLAYHFYLTGPMGVGKSTTINNFRNLIVFDEWAEERLGVLAKPPKKLNAVEKEEVDAWIANQFRGKNDNLRHGGAGIFIVDRPPLDPLAFTPTSEQRAKALRLLETICPEGAWKAQEGTVILLTGDPDELAIRLLLTGRSDHTADSLKRMQEAMNEIYTGTGVTTVDTHSLTIPEVTKRVAEIIHLHDYKPYKLHERLEAFRDGEVEV